MIRLLIGVAAGVILSLTFPAQTTHYARVGLGYAVTGVDHLASGVHDLAHQVGS